MKLWPATMMAMALTACASDGPTPSAQISRVVATTSFGMCVGYCTTRLEISEGRAVLIREARGGRGGGAPGPEQRFSAPLAPAEWREIQRLAASANLQALPDVVGCPDCADGGAEGLTIVGPGGTESVSFEYGARLGPVEPLLERVRALRSRLMPEDSG